GKFWPKAEPASRTKSESFKRVRIRRIEMKWASCQRSDQMQLRSQERRRRLSILSKIRLITLGRHLMNLPRCSHGAARHAVVLTKAGAPSVAWASQDKDAPSATGRIRRGEQGRDYNICGMASNAF